MQDCSYSYLDETTAEPKGLSTGKCDIQSILDDVGSLDGPCVAQTLLKLIA